MYWRSWTTGGTVRSSNSWQVCKARPVVWFYGSGMVIVCTAAFWKAERTPREPIEEAKRLQEQYRVAIARNQIEILDLDTEEEPP